MKKEYLIIAIIALAVLTLVSSVPAMQSTSISEYRPVCPEESYNKITELYEEGLSEDEIAEELAFPVGIVTKYPKGEYIPPVYPEPDQRMPLSECPTYSKIKDLYGEGWSEEEIAETLELPIDVVSGFLSGNYTIISACPEPYQKSEKNVSSSDLIGKHEVSNKQSETGRYEVTVTPSEDELLGKYEKSDRPFKKSVSNRTITYVHYRGIDGVPVDRDHRIYVFDKNTKALIRKAIYSRDALPEHLPPVIPKEQAESIAGGGSATLRFVSPQFFVSPPEQAPKNPCWIVWKTIKTENGIPYYNITIVDAVEGKILGYGIPPPTAGFSFSGPQNVSNCSGVWTELYQNAESWFNTMGYPTEAEVYPNEVKVRSHIQSYETAMFYEVAHGSSYSFDNDCSDSITADEIHNWIADYPKMPFTFLASCGGMCEIGSGTFSYEFRKGSSEDTVTVGYCGMGGLPCNQTCWYDNATYWQDAMFNYMNQGWTVKDAFDQACNEYPGCRDPGCVQFAGDTNFKVVPVVQKMAIGEAVDNTDLSWTTGGDAGWFGQPNTYYYGGDAAQSGTITHNQESRVQTTVTGPGTLKFYWKVSSEANWDFLRFYIDGVEQERISGTVDWQQKTYGISSGSHTLKWRYTKDGSVNSGSDCGWLDKVEFGGDSYEPDNSFDQYSTMSVTTSLQSQSRSIDPTGDNDYIRFYAQADKNYIFYTEGSTDTYGYLYDSNQNQLTYDDDSGSGLNFRIEYPITSSGYYFLRVRGYSSSTKGPYTLYYKYETGGDLITGKSGTLSGTGDSYTFSVSGYSTVTAVMAGNENADFDLYAKWGSPPTTSSYDARGYSSTSLEYFTTSGSGALYIMVRSYSGSGHWKCWALSGSPSANSGRKTGSFSGTGGTATYSRSGSGKGYAFNSGPDGSDFDLYTKWNSPPTTSSYDARGYSSWAQEIAGPASGSGTLYFMVRSYSGSGEYATAALIF